MAQTVLFGGSFDPLHLGHLVAAEFAAEALETEEVWFIPVREQPFKVGQHGAEPEHRLAMLREALANRPGFRAESYEVERPGPSYTVETLRALASRLGARPALLVGSDAAAELPSWREGSVIPKLADIVVFERAHTTLRPLSYPARRIAVPLIDVSATEIRARVRAGRTVRYLVPEAVRAYIERHGLYR